MKKLLISLCAALLTFVSFADNVAVTVPADTATSLLTVPVITDEFTFTATTATTATVKIYDSATTTTNYVQATYVKYASYTTNISSVFTNENGVILTNTFSGLYTYPATVSAVTNSIPAILTVVIPGNTQRSKTIRLQVMRGLVAVSNGAVIVEVDYRKNP